MYAEKGKNFDEESLLDEGGYYNASVIVDEMTDVMVIDEDVYDKYIRVYNMLYDNGSNRTRDSYYPL